LKVSRRDGQGEADIQLTSDILLNFLLKLDSFFLQFLVTSDTLRFLIPLFQHTVADLLFDIRRIFFNSRRLYFFVVYDAFLAKADFVNLLRGGAQSKLRTNLLRQLEQLLLDVNEVGNQSRGHCASTGSGDVNTTTQESDAFKCSPFRDMICGRLSHDGVRTDAF
jgi:hypothetical protein